VAITKLVKSETKLLALQKHSDGRGFFCETFRKEDHTDIDFVQDNVTLSVAQGTVRGLHFQSPPFAQTKLVTVLRGAIFDVALDLRRGSPNFGCWVGTELNAEMRNQLLVPVGFAHGYCTLAPNTLVIYKVDAYYSPDHDRGVLWNDPALGIDWPVNPANAILSEKDRRLPSLSALCSPFLYRG
jgi:dTDP-4-dehydrorhamnose 3,5-epimerase